MMFRSILRKSTNKELARFLTSEYFNELYKSYKDNHENDINFIEGILNRNIDKEEKKIILKTFEGPKIEKLIFLDIDGVLLTYDYVKKCKSLITNFEDIDIPEETMNLLKLIIEKTNAKIILSSSYKKYQSLLIYLTNQFEKYDLEIYGITPNLDSDTASEIVEFIDCFCYKNNLTSENLYYVILTNNKNNICPDKFGSYFHKDSIIQTKENIGINRSVALDAIAVLNGYWTDQFQ